MQSSDDRVVCEQCGGASYRIGAKEEVAVARICSCSSPCPRCNDRRVVMVEQDGRRVAAACSCTDLRRRIELFNAARVPARFADKWVDDIRPTHDSQGRVLYELLRYQDEFERGQKGFLLWGAPGLGKTHLMCGLVTYLTLERGLSCRFIEFMQLIGELKAAYAQGKWDAEVVAPLLKVDVLVIDELGKGKDSEWELGVLDQLISSRYNANRTIHATSNLRPVLAQSELVSYTDSGPVLHQSLQQRLGDRIYSRLVEMCSFQQVQGDDYRVKPPPRGAAPGKKPQLSPSTKQHTKGLK